MIIVVIMLGFKKLLFFLNLVFYNLFFERVTTRENLSFNGIKKKSHQCDPIVDKQFYTYYYTIKLRKINKILSVIPSPLTACVFFPDSYIRTLCVHMALLFSCCLVTGPRRFKISLWHVRCVQYIIGVLTYWIAQPHAVNVSILWSAVIRSNGVRVSGQAVTRECARTGVNALTHTDTGLPPIPGYCPDKMVYPRAICSVLYTWLGMYWVTSLLVFGVCSLFSLNKGDLLPCLQIRR